MDRIAIRIGEEATRPAPAATGRPSVLAIVVTHDGQQWLRDCLVGLNTQTYGPLDVLVVDDATPGGRQEPPLKRVAKRHLKRRRWGFMRTPRPLGFGGAINWALSRVRTDADLLLFIHDDAVLTPGSVEAMVGRLGSDEKIAIVGPKIVSWEDPSRLEEVGMAVDRFGYPYKGLEQGEIDLGQHDVPSEVFFVTSTCMLMRHDVFRGLRGWDARMRAFSEDLDLCWRARLLGYTVRVEPGASARHAIALATGQRRSPFLPARYFSRRNRLRTIAKNASALRLMALAPQFILLAIAEMLAFIVLRQPREILNLTRALTWNFVRIPQTLTERTRVQRDRKVQDRQLGRLIVRQSSRVRFYVAHQADRLEEAWGRRAELLSRRAARARALRSRLTPSHVTFGIVLAVGLILAFRHLLWGPSVTVGEMLPYPDRATALWRAFFSPWHGAGLGQPGPAPPALLPLGVLPILTFGAVGVAQKLLIGLLGALAFVGAYKLLHGIGDRTSQIVAAFLYALGPVGYSGVREGALAALVFGAAAPFVVRSMLRFTGWVRPAGWDPGRELARMAVGVAISAAFVPGSLILYSVAALLLAGTRAVFGLPAVRSVLLAPAALILGWALLLPWSAGWISPGGELHRLMGGDAWRSYAAGFEGHSLASVLLGQTPDGPALSGLALPLLGLVAVLVGEGQRRRMALSLWAIVAVGGLEVVLISRGLLRPIVASPTEAGILPGLAFAALAGLAVAAFRLDLPRRGLGLLHGLTIGALAISMFLLAAGIAPSMWRGQWVPGGRGARSEDAVVSQIRAFLDSEADQSGPFRTLWVGERWATQRSAAFVPDDHALSGARGRVLADLFDRSVEDVDTHFRRAVASIEEGATDSGGKLLGVFGVRYIVLASEEDPERWLRQRDLSLARVEPEFLLLLNNAPLISAGVYTELPVYVRAIEDADPRLTAGSPEIERARLRQESTSTYVGERVSGPGTVFVGESAHEGWSARLDDRALEPVEGGWANAFALPRGMQGRLEVSYDRPLSAWIWLLVVGLAWIAVLGGAFSRAPRRKLGGGS